MAEPKHELVLLQALPKTKAMDVILRMVTEIGISRMQPVYTQQSEVHIPGERVAGKVEKWRATAIEACKQCGLPYLPEVPAPMQLTDWLEQNPADGEDLRLVASLEEGARLLLDTLAAIDLPGRIILAVGPEGDFSSAEYKSLNDGGFVPVRLGDNVLRAETASAYMLSVIDQAIRRSEA